jgi:hypothetical protein
VFHFFFCFFCQTRKKRKKSLTSHTRWRHSQTIKEKKNKITNGEEKEEDEEKQNKKTLKELMSFDSLTTLLLHFFLLIFSHVFSRRCLASFITITFTFSPDFWFIFHRLLSSRWANRRQNQKNKRGSQSFESDAISFFHVTLWNFIFLFIIKFPYFWARLQIIKILTRANCFCNQSQMVVIFSICFSFLWIK